MRIELGYELVTNFIKIKQKYVQRFAKQKKSTTNKEGCMAQNCYVFENSKQFQIDHLK